jgi:hypothetical protein
MMRRRLMCLLIVAACQTTRAADWQSADGPLMTRWAKEVSPDNVWPEYPRPQMVRDHWVNLNGLWDYAVQDKDRARPTAWDGQILVPFAVESALSGVMKAVKPAQRLWYRRTFETPDMRSGDRVLLHFGAVDWDSTVWVNGTQVGTHRGGYDPFSFDITDQLKKGNNELVLSVWDPTDAGYQPRGKQVLKPGGIMYTAVTGIWQTVWLETVPNAHVESLRIVPDIDRSVISVVVNARRAGSVQLSAVDGEQVVATTVGVAGQAVEMKIPNAKLWSPSAPNLYDLKVELIQDGSTIDSVTSYFGMRKTHVAKDAQGVNRLMLNNKVLFQYGPLDQGWWPDGLYTPASDAAMKHDILMTKKFGMNMARKHVKVESARWYYWCDKLGLLVWQDMPAGDSPRNDASKANFRGEYKAMIDALHNFPCIVMWVPFNEGWGQYDTPDIVEWTQKYDPTRPVNEASGWHDRGSGDVSDAHSYPGPGMRLVEKDRVVVLGEFGGLGMPVVSHTWQAEKNWGYISYKTREELTAAYVGLLTRVRPLIAQGLSAAVYTQTSDVEIEVNGLMTYDREVVKMDLKQVADAATKLYLPPPIVKTLVPTSQSQPQMWKYTVENPGNEWFKTGFEDSKWKTGPGGFGTEGTPGSSVRTVWNTSDIWIRRTFELDELPAIGEVSLSIHHDEDAEVYINGQLIRKFSNYVGSYGLCPLARQARKVLKAGKNVIAIHCHQTAGGQYIDAGLSSLIEQE